MKKLVLLAIAGLVLSSCTHKIKNFQKYYDAYKLQGAFVMYDVKNDKFTGYNLELAQKEFLPASTFKILNSLIGLETGVIPDENFVIPWDSIVRPVEGWNRDNSLASAIKVSCVPYYQELARRVGKEKMQYWVEKANYGNKNTGGEIDWFWLRGDLRITAEQQVNFMTRFYKNELPFAQRNIDIVKKIIYQGKLGSFDEYAKTGMVADGDNYDAWYVGYLENADNAYIFCNFVQAPKENILIKEARQKITYEIFKELNIL